MKNTTGIVLLFTVVMCGVVSAGLLRNKRSTCWLDDYDVALKPGSSYSHPMVCMNYHCQDDLSVKVDTCKTTRAEKCSPQIKDLPDFPDCCENYPC